MLSFSLSEKHRIRGSLDEKIRFIFNMYDVSRDGTVSKQDLSTLLNHGNIENA